MASSAAHSHGHDDGHHVEHHLSATPLVVALAGFFTYMGLVFLDTFPPLMAVGPLLGITALVMWVREDMYLWSKGWEMPGVSPGKTLGWWGIVFFLATEVMLFGGLFATFFVQATQYASEFAAGHHHLAEALPLVTINTVILVSSGFTLHWGIVQIRKNNRRGLVIGLALTILLGTIFLAVQAMEYMSLIDHGLTLSSSHFASIFYMLTGTHGAHVFLGLVMIVALFVRALKGQFTADRHVAVDGVAIYWHFVDVVWIILYLIIYVGVGW